MRASPGRWFVAALAIALALGGALLALAPSDEPEDPASTSTPTASLRPARAQVLFDGTRATFEDWQQAPEGSFTLHRHGRFMRSVDGLGMIWYTRSRYRDFSLELEFRDSGDPGGRSNSGVLVRFPDPVEAVERAPAERYPCQVGPAESSPAWVAIFCGHEAQIYDGPTGDPQKTGSIYNFDPLDLRRARPVRRGAWSRYEIRVVGQRYTVIRDGEPINRFRNRPGLEPARAGDPPSDDRRFEAGFIGLQNHGPGDVIDFRNVRVTPLRHCRDRSGSGPATRRGGRCVQSSQER